jgi:hypothetical protein
VLSVEGFFKRLRIFPCGGIVGLMKDTEAAAEEVECLYAHVSFLLQFSPNLHSISCVDQTFLEPKANGLDSKDLLTSLADDTLPSNIPVFFELKTFTDF